MKEELVIPQKYVEMIKKNAKQQSVSADKIVETAIGGVNPKFCVNYK